MNKKQTLTLIAVACSAAAIAFFAKKQYDAYKKEKQRIQEEWDELVDESTRIFEEMADRYNAKEAETEVEEEEEYEPEVVYLANTEIIEEWDEDYILTPEEESLEYYQGIAGMEMEDEEESPLKHDPASWKALEQYKEFRLAEFAPNSPQRQMLMMLFDVNYIAWSNIDKRNLEAVGEQRRFFFRGEGKYATDISMADLILYYAYMLDFDLDGGINYWASYILDAVGFTPGMGAASLSMVCENLCYHAHISPRGYGLFGLNDEQHRRMLNMIPSRDGVSFFAEYNAFLTDALNRELDEEPIEEDN